MIRHCGKAVARLWIGLAAPTRDERANRFTGFPQLFHSFSTVSNKFSTPPAPSLSTFPQDLLLQLYRLTNPYYLDGEFRGPKYS